MLAQIAPRAIFGLAFIVAAALAPAIQAQVLMTLGNGSVFEGNSGTSILKLPVNFAGANATTVTGFASAGLISGTGFHPATPGASCTSGVDFIPFTNVPFTIPPNTANGTLSVNITVCGDTTIEPDEQIFVTLTGVAGGAFCTPESCAAIGTIVNDDGPPSMSINNISVSEPAIASATKTALFTVTLHHTTSQTVTVHFATRDGTAKICTLALTNCGDYFPASGTLSIPPNTLSGTIAVTIRGDNVLEPDETFFVDLSSPTNASILDGTGQATIRDTTLTIGGFDLSPDAAIVNNGDVVAYDLVWTVPDGEVWRNLARLDFRIGDPGNPILWVRWDESSNTLALCALSGQDAAHNRATDHGGPPVVCGAGAAPGSATPLVTPSAQLLLADSTVVGSGPTGRTVALHLVVAFGPQINARPYPVALSAADDFGNVDKFVVAAEVTVQ